MRTTKRLTLAAPPPDPFGEHHIPALCERRQLMGGRFDFETDSTRLLRIVRQAYAGLPAHRLARRTPHLRLRLVLIPGGRARTGGREPPPMRPLAAGGLLCGALDGATFVALNPQRGTGLLGVSHHLLRSAYHVRYELLEFAVYVLAARVQGLVPLHAACVGRGGQGILLVGASGAGKSTLVLHCLLSGLDLLAEDSVLLRPQGLLATGVANFLHLRPDSLRFLSAAQRSTLVKKSAVIRRRSGVRKLEVDLRRPPYHLAATPLRICAVVFLSATKAGGRTRLAPLPAARALGRLRATQRYAANQPGWETFTRQLPTLPAYELRRGAHPRDAVEALRTLLTHLPA
jgi:hypothetical protein